MKKLLKKLWNLNWSKLANVVTTFSFFIPVIALLFAYYSYNEDLERFFEENEIDKTETNLRILEARQRIHNDSLQFLILSQQLSSLEKKDSLNNLRQLKIDSMYIAFESMKMNEVLLKRPILTLGSGSIELSDVKDKFHNIFFIQTELVNSGERPAIDVSIKYSINCFIDKGGFIDEHGRIVGVKRSGKNYPKLSNGVKLPIVPTNVVARPIFNQEILSFSNLIYLKYMIEYKDVLSGRLYQDTFRYSVTYDPNTILAGNSVPLLFAADSFIINDIDRYTTITK